MSLELPERDGFRRRVGRQVLQKLGDEAGDFVEQ
jgi:hypothetical protein